ncbi:MAG: quinone-dependent dihydroorotate dehydrogenase [Candidatus Magasanikbacteria bacterium]
MKNSAIKTRNFITRVLYQNIAKPIFFLIDPEKIHDIMIRMGNILGSNGITRSATSLFFSYSDKRLEQNILGIPFKNPIGLAAGFDKNAEIIDILPSCGFGYGEVGSITGEPCEGNPKPRLWRLKKSKGLVVYYGLKNNGCEHIAGNLKEKKYHIPIGISIAKTNCKLTADKTEGIKDYAKAFAMLEKFADYITINISCPNAFGGQPFTNPQDLNDLLTDIEKIPSSKPIFLKLSPDVSFQEIDDLIHICDQHRVHGFICTNLTKDKTSTELQKYWKEAGQQALGGISGKPIKDMSTKLIAHVYQKTKGKYIIIGCGGVSSAEDAYEKIKAGASLIQLITGMIFEGPQVISEINRKLVELLRYDGYQNISEAIAVSSQKY